MKRLYFGHPINTYGTPFEARLLKVIGLRFPDWQIEDPNQEAHSEGYKRYAARTVGMDYFFLEVLPYMQGGVFLPFQDGAFGAGVFAEMKYLHERGMPIWQITLDCKITEITHLFMCVVLDVPETRVRVRNEDGSTKNY